LATEAAQENEGSVVGRIAAVAALALAIALVAVLLFGDGRSYEVTARFLSAGQLVKGNLVQASGQPVGTVKSIELADDGHADVKLAIDDEVAPLRRGTQANLRTASLSGVANRYVDLIMPAGEEQDEIPDGGVIPVEDTTTAVDLDQLFALFDERTRKGLRNVIRGFGASYEERFKEANAGWEYLNPSLVASRRLFAELTYDERTLQRFLVSNSKLMTDLADRDDDLSLLVDKLAVTFGAIARERTSLTRAVAELAPFMRRANTTFVNLRATLDDLDPLVEESIPVTPKLRAVLAELRPFARDATPTFRNLAVLVKTKGEANDLTDLAHSTLPFRDVTTRPGTYNGKQREGSFAAARRSLRGQTPQFAFQRPYAVDLTGWFDDFSHSGIYDANGSASRVSTTVSAFAFLDGTLKPVPEELRGKVFSEVATLGQRNRCPGAAERPAPDRSNPYRPSGDFNCDPSQIPPGP
jgi:phospholipid/cholesterol/gamma-HCH transport system substrate-binding protein